MCVPFCCSVIVWCILVCCSLTVGLAGPLLVQVWCCCRCRLSRVGVVSNGAGRGPRGWPSEGPLDSPLRTTKHTPRPPRPNMPTRPEHHGRNQPPECRRIPPPPYLSRHLYTPVTSVTGLLLRARTPRVPYNHLRDGHRAHGPGFSGDGGLPLGRVVVPSAPGSLKRSKSAA